MSEITAEQAKALRQPFSGVQKVKKEWTGKDGQRKSITLDYISHAVVTDRLLSVDPGYSFEPLLDDRGFPIIVTEDHGLGAGDRVGVWGRLTILGTTVVEFCGGKDLLDAYSRCLARAAMRRGVALDLWIKDDEFKANGSDASAEPKVPAAPKVPTWPPRNWTELEEGVKQRYGAETWDAFAIIAAKVRDVLYPEKEGQTLTKAQKDVLWQKAKGAALSLEAGERFDGWAPNLDELVMAFKAVGVELPAEDAEIDALADAALTGPRD